MTTALTPLTTYEFLSRLRLPEERGFLEFRALPVSPRLKPQQTWQEWPPGPDFDGQYAFGGEYEVYYGVLLRKRRQGDSQHVGPGSVAWAEFDLGGSRYLEASKEEVKHFPPGVLREAAHQLWLDLYDELEELELRPLAAVCSGQGVHVYWGLTETRAPAWLERANRALIRLLAAYNPEKSPYDRARILRVPGTVHRKNPARPLPVEVLYLGETRHHPEKFEGFLELEEPKPLPQALERALQAGLSPWTPSPQDLRRVVEGWTEGRRNQLAMALGGWCASRGMSERAALDLVERICQEAGDAEVGNRRGAVANSYQRFYAGLPVLGFSTLRRLVGELEGGGTVTLGVLSSAQAESEAREQAGEDLTLPPEYRLGDHGELLYVEVKTTRFGPVERVELLAPRWVGVRESLHDLKSGEVHVKLAWQDLDGALVERVVPLGAACTRQGLLELAAHGFPAHEKNAAALTQYVQACYSHNRYRLPRRRVSGAMGWVGKSFVLPGGEIEVLGVEAEPWRVRGDQAAWLEALKALFSWGVTPALVAAGLSAAAPLVRRLNLPKNPILALSTTSHTGKTTAVRFALSLWASPEYNEALYFDNATLNGLMGRLMARQDLPVGLDDHQRYEDRQVNELLHLLSGGAEKARSRRDGLERSARRWKGVALLTGELSALRETLGSGAANRLIELSDYPLGVGKGAEGAARSRVLRLASDAWGGLREAVLGRLERPPGEIAELEEGAVQLDCPADMASAVALAAVGVRILAEASGVDPEVLPETLVVYLSRTLQQQRELHGSLAGRAMEALRGLLGSLMADENSTEILDGRQLVAFERGGRWFISPTAREVERVMRPFGGLEAQLGEWAREGWIETEEDGNKRRYKIRAAWKGVYSRYVVMPVDQKKS